MRNLFLTLAYNGAAYHGWQRQNNAVTVQQTVEEALSELLSENVTVNGCSRTDAGVHAKTYCLTFGTGTSIPPQGLIRGLNDKLPDDIAVRECREMPEGFHARFDCKGKEYLYIVHNSDIKDPFYKDTAMRWRYPIDAELLDREAKDFIGEHDFKAFCSADCDKENTVREIYSFDVRREGELVRFTVSGSGFLYNMVRIMVGTLLYIGEGKIARGSIPRLIASRDRTLTGKTVEPQGLYLNRVFYDNV
ncbi:tRNA pseudouridine38-40 synthase [Ruminococcaceae bacterium FB2012]|nr:tRNA pseudouridine38-40 synthase [Ruminococcaceae bacterium FB2012]